MLQDANGYVWLGTDKGLVRFDGKQFKTYINAASSIGAMSDLRIDKNGQLHCQNFSGKHFYMRNDSLYVNNQLPENGNFSRVLQDNKLHNYFVSFNTVYRTKTKSDTIRFEREIYGLFEFEDQVFTFDSVQLYPLSSSQQPQKIPFKFKRETVFFTVNIQGKAIVFPRILKQRSAYCFLPQFNMVSVDLPEVLIQSVNVVQDSLVFIATNNGLYVLDKELKQLPLPQPLFNQKNVSGVMRDMDGALWVSTLDNGVFKFDCFNCLTTETNEPAQTLAFLQGDKQVLCGTTGGKVYQWISNHSLQKIYESNKRQPITALYRTGNGTLFVGGDVFTIKSKTSPLTETLLAVKKIIPFESNSFALARTGGISILSPSDKFTDTAEGIELYRSKDWLIKDWYIINNTNLRVKNLAYDATGKQLYASTSIGLLQLNQKAWTSIKHNNAPLNVNDIAIRNDTLFAVSNNALLLVKNGKLLYETKVMNTAAKHIRVNENEVWLSAGSKMYCLNNALQNKAIFELTNGYEINDFCIADNNLVMATDAGVTSVAIAALSANIHPLKFYIELFSANGKRLDFQIDHSLHHTAHNLKLVFSVPFYGKQEALAIQYKVNGEPWQMMESGLRELNLISLEPGDYDIQLKAIADDGRTSAIEKLAFTIRPPFWKTWWFYALSLLAVASAAFLLYRYRLNLIQKQNDLEKQTITLENKLRESILASVKAQMNPHFIFNALNTIQSFIYLNDKQQATEYLGKFSQLTRTILDMSNKNSVSLEEEIAAMLLYLDLEKIRFDEAMDYTIEVSPQVNPALVRIPSMIIQPYVENAVKHGLLHKKGERWLKLSFDLQNNMLKVTVEDNGIGRARSEELNKIKNKQHQSFATQANEKRLDALNRGNSGAVSVRYIDKVSVHGGPQGTTVVLMIAILEE